MSVKMIATDKFKHGQTNILPYIGETTFGENGEFEVPDQETAEKLAGLEGLNFEIVEKSKKTITTPIAPQITPEGDLMKAPVTGQEGGSKSTDQELIDSLPTLKVEDLKKLCESYPKDEWGKLTTKKDLIAYITGKLSA